jgi:hypothetical protein
MLHHFEAVDKLCTALGDWIYPSHQNWMSFYDILKKEIVINTSQGWITHSPIFTPSVYSTRMSTYPWYDYSNFSQTAPNISSLLPASIIGNHRTDGSLFQAFVSTSSMPTTSTTIHGHVINDDSLSQLLPHPFYQEILQWKSNDITSSIEGKANAIESNDLFICADGTYMKSVSQASHAWVFSNSKLDILWKGAGPTPGHSSLMTPYRAELTGLTSVLFMIYWVCRQTQIAGGLITIYCDNETALSETFKTTLSTNNPYDQLAADIDIITLSRDLLSQLPATITITNQ